ncbi:MAG: fumarylacetoacetase, partial [Planctomycetota bacterium]
MRDTTDPTLTSWIDAANDPACGFPIQNLPFGVAAPRGAGDKPRCVSAIGDCALDLSALHRAGLFAGTPVEPKNVFAQPALNAFFALGRGAWSAVRERLSELLDARTPTLRDDAALRDAALIPLDQAEPRLPVVVGDYTDFYASAHHATNVGRMFRPGQPPLLPNYKHLPVGYHGRASTVVLSGAPVRRPMGQTKADDADAPVFGPCRLLDYELEMAAVVGAGNEIGTRVDIARWRDHLVGLTLLNDWSARDIQKWEYVPLGPFNAKNFATTISPWIVTFDALAPFAAGPPARGPEDPPNLDYLTPPGEMYGVTLEVLLESAAMRDAGAEPVRVSLGSLKDMYWTVAQMLAHHTSTGCAMRTGDLLGTGTVSGPDEESRGCLLERTWRGTQPLTLPTGEERTFLADGDTVIIRGWCER